jgi:hypothetical protein
VAAGRVNEETFGVNGRTAIRRLAWASRALAMPLSILAHTPRVLRHPDLTGSDRLRALGTLARLRLLRMVWMLGQALRG